jgi:hypothetical protein
MVGSGYHALQRGLHSLSWTQPLNPTLRTLGKIGILAPLSLELLQPTTGASYSEPLMCPASHSTAELPLRCEANTPSQTVALRPYCLTGAPRSWKYNDTNTRPAAELPQ